MTVERQAAQFSSQTLPKLITELSHSIGDFEYVSRQFAGRTEADDQRDWQRAAAEMLLVPASVEERLNRNASAIAADDERSDSIRAVKFVGRKAQQIDGQLLQVDRQFAEDLHGIAVQQDISFTTDLANFEYRAQRADFVVGEHDGDEHCFRLDRVGQLLRIDLAKTIDR